MVQILYRNLDNKKYKMPAYNSHQQGSISFFCFVFFKSNFEIPFEPWWRSRTTQHRQLVRWEWGGSTPIDFFEIYSMFPKKHKTNYTRWYWSVIELFVILTYFCFFLKAKSLAHILSGGQGSLLFSKFEFSIKPDFRDLSFL